MTNENIERYSLIKELLEYPTDILRLALANAYSMREFGVDITQKWETAVQQMDAMYRAERKGYADAMTHMYGKQLEELDEKYGITRHKNYEEEFINAQKLYEELLQQCKGMKIPKWEE